MRVPASAPVGCGALALVPTRGSSASPPPFGGGSLGGGGGLHGRGRLGGGGGGGDGSSRRVMGLEVPFGAFLVTSFEDWVFGEWWFGQFGVHKKVK